MTDHNDNSPSVVKRCLFFLTLVVTVYCVILFSDNWPITSSSPLPTTPATQDQQPDDLGGRKIAVPLSGQDPLAYEPLFPQSVQERDDGSTEGTLTSFLSKLESWYQNEVNVDHHEDNVHAVGDHHDDDEENIQETKTPPTVDHPKPDEPVTTRGDISMDTIINEVKDDGQLHWFTSEVTTGELLSQDTTQSTTNRPLDDFSVPTTTTSSPLDNKQDDRKDFHNDDGEFDDILAHMDF